MWSFTWRNPDNAHRVFTCKPYKEYKRPSGQEELLVTAEFSRSFGLFQTVTLTGAATTTIVAPKPGGSILVTDIVVSAKKVASTTLIIEFDDGTNTEVIFAPDTVQQSTNFAWSLAGRLQGWRDAALKVVTTGANTDARVTAVYVPLGNSLVFADWDALR